MITMKTLFKGPLRKLIYVFTLTLLSYIAISGIFSIPMNQTTHYVSKNAGGLAFYAIGLLFLVTVLKATFLELVKNSSARSTGQKIFRVIHRFLGWIIFSLAFYHSMFFVYYYIWPIDTISLSVLITGVITLICLVFVMVSGRKAMFNKSPLESVYLRHIIGTVVLIALIVFHLNFL